MPPKQQQQSGSSGGGDGNSFVMMDFPIAGLAQLFGLSGLPGLRVSTGGGTGGGGGGGATSIFSALGRQQQTPAVEHRGVGHIFQGEMNPRAWIDREQRRGQLPPNSSSSSSRNGSSNSNNNNNNSQSSSTTTSNNNINNSFQPETAVSLRDRGNEAFRHNHLQEALSLYTAALNLNPACETTLTNRATTHFKLKNYEAAAADARRAVQIKPDYFKAHYRLGMSLFQLGYYEEAIEALRHGETLTSDEDTKQDIRIQIAKAESKLKTRNAAQEDAAEKMIQQEMMAMNNNNNNNNNNNSNDQSLVVFSSPLSAKANNNNNNNNTSVVTVIESPNYATSFPPITPLAPMSFPADVPLPTPSSSRIGSTNQFLPSSFKSFSITSTPPTVSLDSVVELAKEARNWRGLEEEGETFVSENLVEALGLLTSSTTAEHEKIILQECNPETIQHALDEYNKAQQDLRIAAKDPSNRDRFHAALRIRDEKLHAALKVAAKIKFAMQRLHELRSRNDACRTVIDRQLHHQQQGSKTGSGNDTNSSRVSDDAAPVPPASSSSNDNNTHISVSSASSSPTNTTTSTTTTIEEVPQLIQEYKKLRTELAGEVQSAMAKTDRAAAEFLSCLREEQRILQDTGRDRSYLAPLRSISNRIIKAARQKLQDQSSLLSPDRVREIDSLIRRVEADRASLQRATFDGHTLLDAESALERDRLNFERQRIQLQAEFDWLLVKEEEDERKLQSLRRNIERVKEQSSAISKKQHDIQQKILRLIDSDLPELAWKAAAGGKKILKWAKGSGYWVNLSLSDFEIIRTLATTPSSKVLQARSKRDGTVVAIKEVQVETEALRRRFQNEVNIVSGLASHRNVVQIQGVFFDGQFAYIVMPFFELGSILDWIKKQGIKKRPMKEWRLQEFLRQIVSALAALHDQGVLHADVKLNNLLLSDEMTPILADFGLARDVGRYSERADVTYDTTNFRGTQNYAAPELLNPPQIDTLLAPQQQQRYRLIDNSSAPTSALTTTTTSNSQDSALLLASPTALAMSTGKPTMRSDIYSLGISLLQIAAANHKALQEEKEENARKQKEEKEARTRTTSNQADSGDNSEGHHRSSIRQAVHADAALDDQPSSTTTNNQDAAASSSSNNNNNNNTSSAQTVTRGSDLSRALVLHNSSYTNGLQNSSSSSSALSPLCAFNSDDYLLEIPEAAAGRTVDPKVVGNDKLADLLTEMISVDPTARPSAQEILAHPYFSVSLLEESVKSNQLDESNQKLEVLSSHIHALRAVRRNPVLVSVERNQMVESVSAIVSQMKDEALLNPLFVVFRGEEGLDEGGLTGELIQLYFMQSITNHRLLSCSGGNDQQQQQQSRNSTESPSSIAGSQMMNRESTAVPVDDDDANVKSENDNNNNNKNKNKNDDDEHDHPLTGGAGRILDSDPIVMLDTPYLPSDDKLIPPGLFETMGRMLLKALIENRPIPILLSSVVFKHIVGLRPNMMDLEEYDRNLWRQLRQFQFFSAEQLEATMMSFDEFPSTMLTNDLKFDPSICNKDVTSDNVKDYITAKTYFILVYSRKNALDAIKRGFFACDLLNNHLRLLSPIELQIALCGQQHITAHDVIALLDFVNFPSDSQTPKFVVEAITNMSQNNLRRFLRLTTSSVTIPRGGQGRSARIRVVCTHDLDRLPVGHTCVNQLDLPNYESREKLMAKLATALAHAEDGFFVL